jgi:hypothetical protein
MRGGRWHARGSNERGQATVEWIGILLLVALALAALARFAPSADGQALATTLARSITHPDAAQTAARELPTAPTAQVGEIGSGKRNQSLPPDGRAFIAPPLVPQPAPAAPRPGPRPRGAPAPPRWPGGIGGGALSGWLRRVGDSRLAGRLPRRLARRAVGGAWRRAWYACLVYERFRWAFLHPESRFPGYTMPPEEVLRIANDCISPVDLFRDWPMLTGQPR